MIDPALQQIAAVMAAGASALPQPVTAAGLRAAFDVPMPLPPVEVATVRDVTLAGADGPIAARLYHPRPSTRLPVAVMMHGGGWVVGTLDTHDGLARALAHAAGCAVVSLAYRLAPEHPFPAGLDDCRAAIADLPAHAEDFAIDADRYAVVGDSAGGNLAAAVALALAGRPGAPAAQVLFYPVIDCRFDTPSYRGAPAEGLLTEAMMRWFWQQYLGDAEPGPLAAPIRAESLAGVAPATVILAGNDPLHDEGLAYARALQAAGVATDVHDFSGAIHGFASFVGLAPIAGEAVALAAAGLRLALFGAR